VCPGAQNHRKVRKKGVKKTKNKKEGGPVKQHGTGPTINTPRKGKGERKTNPSKKWESTYYNDKKVGNPVLYKGDPGAKTKPNLHDGGEDSGFKKDPKET